MADDIANFLPKEYTWQGCFEYKYKTEGHQWNYVEKKKWGIFEDPNDSSNLTHFTKKARKFKNKLPFINATKQVNEQNGPYESLLNWFLDKEKKGKRSSSFHCGADISVILNTITKEQTFKPFEVIASFCDGPSTIHLRNLPQYTPCWFYFSKTSVEDILLQFLLCIKEPEKINIDDLREQLRYIRILHKYTPLEVINNSERLQILLRIETTIIDYVRGRVCNCLPIPGSIPKIGRLEGEGHRSEPEAVNSPEVIVSSQAVVKALEDFGQIWQDTFAGAVLISAPPGSGKEEFAKSIPYGNGRPTENIQAVSMADCDSKALQRRLYGEERDGVYVPGSH